MKRQSFMTTLCVFCASFAAISTAHGQLERIAAELGGVQMVVIDQDPAVTPGYLAARLELRAVDPSATLVTFENLKIEGPLVQTWLSGPFGSSTPKNVAASQTYPAEWIPYDSHLNITSENPNMIGGQAGEGFVGIDETNDMSIGLIPGLPDVLGTPSGSGVGAISMVNPTDAFFLAPEFQSNVVDFAYVVIPDTPGSMALVTVGVLGDGITNSGEPGGANFGFNGDNGDTGYAVIYSIPEPSTGITTMAAFALISALRRRRCPTEFRESLTQARRRNDFAIAPLRQSPKLQQVVLRCENSPI